MKKSKTLSILLIVVSLATTGLVWASDNSAEEILALSKARLSLTQAIDAALADTPGKALSAELSEDIPQAFVVEVVQQGRSYEVTIDAQTGKLIDKKLDREDDDDHDGDREERD